MKKKIFRLVENNTFKPNKSSLPTYATTITVTEDVTVEYEYTSSSPRDIKIISVYDKDGKKYELTKKQNSQIRDEILQYLSDHAWADWNDQYRGLE